MFGGILLIVASEKIVWVLSKKSSSAMWSWILASPESLDCHRQSSYLDLGDVVEVSLQIRTFLVILKENYCS